MRRLRSLVALLAFSACLLSGCSEPVAPSKSPSSTVEDFLRASRDVCERFSWDKPGVEPGSVPAFQRYVMGKMGPFLSQSADLAFRNSFQERLATLSEHEGVDPNDPADMQIYEFADAMANMEYTIISEDLSADKATVLTELKTKNSKGESSRSEKLEFHLVVEDGRWVLTFEAFSGGVPLPDSAHR